MIKLYIEELKPGMVLEEAVISADSGKLLLSYGTRLTEKTIKLLKNYHIKQVSIAERYTLLVQPVENVAKELSRELQSRIIHLAPDSVEANTSDKMVLVSQRVREIALTLLEDDQVLSFCVEMKILNRELLFNHGINTCAMSMLVAGAMDLSDYEIYNIGIAALLHDLGLCEMPFLINTEHMNVQQELLWQEHPTYGYYFAKEKDVSVEISKIILHHHERWNGSGFPQKLSGEAIPLGSRIISVCEEYDRLIRYKQNKPYQAIEYLYGSGGYHFDMKVVNAFTNNLAVYPLGSMVRLTTGEVGIVVNVRKNLGPRPIVRLYYNRVKKPMSQPVDIDLGSERTLFIEEVY